MRILLFCIGIFYTTFVFSNIAEREDVKTFINEMHEKHQYDKAKLNAAFTQTVIKESTLKAISRPAEGLPWSKYRKIFITDKRIKNGVKFWRENIDSLARVEQEFGVPPEIIVAIIGVETAYGENTGGFRIIDALSTLAFEYPRRAKFFRSELEQFFLLVREQDFDPMTLTGSYAGAMGLPQFMPSSYRHYAINFDTDRRIDIWNNTEDTIGSVGNYFHVHGWIKNEPIATPVQPEDNGYKDLLSEGLKPIHNRDALALRNIFIDEDDINDSLVKVLELELENSNDVWLAHQNFYVITRYNHSQLYAMAVYQLSESIKKQYFSLN